MQPPRTAGQPFEERRRRWCALIRRGGSCVPRCLELQLIIASGIFRLSRSRTNSYGTRYEADAGVVIARWDIERTTDADRLQEYSEKKRVFFFSTAIIAQKIGENRHGCVGSMVPKRKWCTCRFTSHLVASRSPWNQSTPPTPPRACVQERYGGAYAKS